MGQMANVVNIWQCHGVFSLASALVIRSGLIAWREAIKAAMFLTTAGNQPAQPRLLRAGSPEAGCLGGRPEARPGAGDQGDRPPDQGSAPHRRDRADAGREAVVAEEATGTGRQAQQAAPRAVCPAGRS